MDMPSHVKNSILTHRSSQALEYSATKCLDVLCMSEKYDCVITLVDRLVSMVFSPPAEWAALKDFALIQCASERSVQKNGAPLTRK